jgi:hypothetical protein
MAKYEWRVESCGPAHLGAVLNQVDADGYEVFRIMRLADMLILVVARRSRAVP